MLNWLECYVLDKKWAYGTVLKQYVCKSIMGVRHSHNELLVGTTYMYMCVYIHSCISYIPSLLLSGAAGVGVIANGKSETKDDYS